LMVDAFETSNAIARNDTIRALDRLAQVAGVGSGSIAERIPSHEMKATMVDVMEALHKAAKDNGVADADYIAMRDMVEGAMGDDVRTTLFRPAVINEKGEAIAFYRDGGELKALRLADGQFGRDMQRALSGMTRTEKQIFDTISLPLAKAASISRLGVVADVPFLIKNFIRDQVQAFIFYGNPVKTFTGTLEGMKAEVMGKDIARAYNAYGGIMGGANTATVRDARTNHSLNALARKGWVANRFTSFKGLLEATELSETGMRLNIFQRFTEEAKGRGLMDHEALLEGAYQARDYIDFDRRGSLVTPVARLVPFLNANLQGLDKFSRHMIAPLFREGVTVAEQKARGEAAKSWARISALITGTLALHAVMSEDEFYNDADPSLKARNWLFKWDGAWVAIPKPFEAAFFINMGPAIFDGVNKHDPRWGETIKESARAAFLPPDIVLGNPIVKTIAEAYTGNDLRTGSQIIPNGKESLEPFLQYTQRTSTVARKMSDALSYGPQITQFAPTVIDQLILNFTTSLGRTALSLSDFAMSDKPIGGWDDFVITSSFIKDISRNASSQRAFWDLVGQRNGALEGARRSYEQMLNGGDAKAASDYYNTRDDNTKAWIALGSTKPDVRRLNPFMRARNAVTAINELRRAIAQSSVPTADGAVDVSRRDRGAVDERLGDDGCGWVEGQADDGNGGLLPRASSGISTFGKGLGRSLCHGQGYAIGYG
jgi:Large polyvalent protein associated domain 38